MRRSPHKIGERREVGRVEKVEQAGISGPSRQDPS